MINLSSVTGVGSMDIMLVVVQRAEQETRLREKANPHCHEPSNGGPITKVLWLMNKS